MKQSRILRRSLYSALIGLGFGLVSFSSTAALSISEPSARIGWGGADNLRETRTISTQTNRMQRIDSGYSSVRSSSVPVTYQSSNGSTVYGPTSFTRDGYNSNRYGNTSYVSPLNISTGSRGVLVLDVETNQPLYQKNADVARPIASITKLMTAMVLLDASQDMREEIILEPIDFVGPKRASSGLRSGDRMNRAELMLMMLMKSENPAAKSLARHYPGGYDAFMAAMNRKAQSLGMSSAYFGDPTGLDRNNVASPADLAKMVRAAGNYEVIRRFSTTPNYNFFVANYSDGNRTYPARNTSYLVRDSLYPIGISKTGFIDESGKCVVMETRVNNRPAIIVLLGARNSATRWDDAENILNNLAMRRSI